MTGGSKAQILFQLRGLIASHEADLPLQTEPDSTSQSPWERIAPASLHEIAPADWRDGPGALGFALALIARRGGPFVWLDHPVLARDFGRPYGPGLKGFGLDPARLVHIAPRTDADLLWAMEEAARLSGLGGVIGCLPAASKACDLTATRRLVLAAEKSGALLILLRDAGPAGLTAARTRWRIATHPADLSNPLDSHSPIENILGTLNRAVPARWSLTLERSRDGKPGTWLIEWHDASLCFHLSAPSGDRPDQTATDPRPANTGPANTGPAHRLARTG